MVWAYRPKTRSIYLNAFSGAPMLPIYKVRAWACTLLVNTLKLWMGELNLKANWKKVLLLLLL